MPILLPVLLIGSGVVFLVVLATADGEDAPHDHDPDLPPMPGSTRYKRVDQILDELKKASAASGIPLGLLVGWIATESGGKVETTPRVLKGQTEPERGLFQLHPEESRALGLDHRRLSTDVPYSINAGLLLIAKYMGLVDKFNVAQRGSTYYWTLVKLAHAMGSGATKIIVEGAKAAGEANTWERLREHALDNESRYLSATKHSPSKWLPHVEKAVAVGGPFGFGYAGQAIVGGGALFADIVDPLDCLK